jgi:hypothetical protein
MDHQLRVQANNKDLCSFCPNHLSSKHATFYKPYVNSSGLVKIYKCCKSCFYGKKDH